MPSLFDSAFSSYNGYILTSLLVGTAMCATWSYYRRVIRAWQGNISLLGHPRGRKLRGTVVICGGSFAGIISARICADHFENVLIVDPDIEKAGKEFAKKRVAQYDSLHAYLTFLVDGLRRLWPTLDAMVEQAGGVFRPADFQLHFGGIPLLAAQSAYPTPTARPGTGPQRSGNFPDTMLIRRPKLEAVLYRLLMDSSASCIQPIQGIVTGLIPSENMTSIQNVNIQLSGGEEKIVKDVVLVVDCTGSVQAGLKWLKSAGFISSSPVSDGGSTRNKDRSNAGTGSNLRISYDHKMRYVTITFENLGDLTEALPIPGGFDQAGFIYTYYAHFKWGNEGFVLSRMDDSIQLCCGGWGDVHLPKERDGILPYVRAVKGAHPAQPWVVELVETLVGSDAAITFKPLKIPPPSSVQYHKIPQSLPSNFIAIGDSGMQLNPIYAQGCSKALYGAMTLNALLHNCAIGEVLGRVPSTFGKMYFQRAHTIYEDLWASTKAIDYGYSTTIPVKGESRLMEGALIRWYAYNAARAAEKDKAVASALWHVRMLATPQIELFKPRVVWGVLRWAALDGMRFLCKI